MNFSKGIIEHPAIFDLTSFLHPRIEGYVYTRNLCYDIASRFSKGKKSCGNKKFFKHEKNYDKNFSQQVSLPFIQMEVVPRDSKV